MTDKRVFRHVNMPLRAGTALAVLAVISLPSVAHAQAANEQASAEDPSEGEIVVTAQRRAEKLTDVPIAVTSVSGDTLTAAGIASSNSLGQVVPAFRLDYNGAFAQPTIRGVTTALANVGGGSSVGVYTDGFFNASPLTQDFELLNVSNIQVLKGPQGTLFGRNTTGGAVLVITGEPQQEIAVTGMFEYSSFDTVRAAGYITGGIAPGLAVDLAVKYKYTNGWFTNLTDGNDHVAGGDDFNLRAGVKLDLGESGDSYALFRYARMRKYDPTAVTWSVYEEPDGRFQTAAFAFGIPGAIWGKDNRHTAADPGFEPNFRAQYDSYQLTTKFDLGFADMTNYDQYRDEKSRHEIEVDVSNIPLFAVSFDSFDKLKTHETLLTSKPGGKLSWVAGLFYLDQKASSPFRVDVPALGDQWRVGIHIKSYSVYADATYQVGDQLYLTGGGRYSHDTQDGRWDCTPTGVLVVGCPRNQTGGLDTAFTLKFNNFSPRAVIRYELDPNASIYASVTRGYKSGLANTNGFSTVPIKPEKITAYEAGFKMARGRSRFELAGFYYDYKNLQVSTYTGTRSITTNAAASEVYGGEISFAHDLGDYVSLSGGLAYTHGRYTFYPGAPGNFYDYVLDGRDTAGVLNGGATDGQVDNRSIDASGNHMIRSPDLSGNVAVDAHVPLAGGTLRFNGNLYYSSKVFFDAANKHVQKAYTLTNVRLGWTDPSDHATISVFANNLTNEEVIGQVLPNGLASAIAWTPPRSIGVALNFNY